MFETVESPYLVPFDGSFKVSRADTRPPKDGDGKNDRKDRLRELVEELSELQKVLYAHDHYALLLVFQAMDAAGKDSTIGAVLSGVNPAGCEVTSFKQPSSIELAHDFLWRYLVRLPRRGRIGVFNRSYFESVLVERVHPEFLDAQNLPQRPSSPEKLWAQRLESIRAFEEHLARNGTVILKFWLNVSRDEQRDRFLSRLNEPEKNWKFDTADVHERERWHDYMRAYEEALNATSRAHAPWYAIPADNKPFMRAAVADIVVRKLKTLDLHYPKLGDAEKARFGEMRRYLSG